jgi:RNA polymerase sigma-70 factor (ECF subfamily)
MAISLYHRRRSVRPAEVPLEEQTATEDDGLERAVLALDTTEALRDLSLDHRRVIIELFYWQRSVAEAAEVLGIPEGTVRSRCFYALRALREVFHNKGVAGP